VLVHPRPGSTRSQLEPSERRGGRELPRRECLEQSCDLVSLRIHFLVLTLGQDQRAASWTVVGAENFRRRECLEQSCDLVSLVWAFWGCFSSMTIKESVHEENPQMGESGFSAITDSR